MNADNESVFESDLYRAQGFLVCAFTANGIVCFFVAVNADDELVGEHDVFNAVGDVVSVGVEDTVPVSLFDGRDDFADVFADEGFASEWDDDLGADVAGFVDKKFKHFESGFFVLSKFFFLVDGIYEALVAVVVAEFCNEDL